MKRKKHTVVSQQKERSVKKSSQNLKPTSIKRKHIAHAPLVGLIMGSKSDWPIMIEAANVLENLGISYEANIISAHRTPMEMVEYASDAENRGLRVIIAGAGGAAHLPGMVASLTALPVIGVPVPLGPLQGEDALLSIVQMPKGVPVATVAIGNAHNAGLLAAKILAYGSPNNEFNAKLREELNKLRTTTRLSVLSQKLSKKS